MTLSKPVRERSRDIDGQYNFESFNYMCICGHTLSHHLANKPRCCQVDIRCNCEDFKRRMIIWVAHYKCGCVEEASKKRDLTGYCGKHGDDLLEPIIKMEDSNL